MSGSAASANETSSPTIARAGAQSTGRYRSNPGIDELQIVLSVNQYKPVQVSLMHEDPASLQAPGITSQSSSQGSLETVAAAAQVETKILNNRVLNLMNKTEQNTADRRIETIFIARNVGQYKDSEN